MIVNELWNDSALRDTIATQARNSATSEICDSSSKSPLECFRKLSVPPIGWANDSIRHTPQGIQDWLFKILGVLISTVAVAMGAPFCFNLLNKLVNLRLTGNPPPDSRRPAAS